MGKNEEQNNKEDNKMKLEVNNNEEENINNKIRRNKKTIFKESKRYIEDENDINSYQNNNLNKEKETEKNIILGKISKNQENIEKQENSISNVYYKKNDRKELLKMRIDKGMKMAHIDDRKK